jgi:lipase maturation factor 1
VTALLMTNPFRGKPPTYVRAELYEYTYAGNDAAGRWWNRRLAGLYFPKVRLKTETE